METPIVKQLVEEIKEHPQAAVELLTAMSRVVKPWQETNVGPLEEGRGQNVVKAFLRTTVTGEELALIQQNFPTWHIRVMGERPTGAPDVFNKKDAERESKAFVDEMLVEMGYILMEDEEE